MLKITDKHVFFYTEWPSNFHRTSFDWEAFGERNRFFCTEQAFMWAKAKYFGDDNHAIEIMNSSSPLKCKQIGRLVENYSETEWNLVRYSFMYDVNLEKYAQDKELFKRLTDKKYDGKVFVEASPTDRIWGIGLGKNDSDIDDEKKWNGQNLLGQVITQVRNVLLMQNCENRGVSDFSVSNDSTNEPHKDSLKDSLIWHLCGTLNDFNSIADDSSWKSWKHNFKMLSDIGQRIISYKHSDEYCLVSLWEKITGKKFDCTIDFNSEEIDNEEKAI